ncbi:uncharacterized protein [Physcomitrium patens]|nr:cytosolic purine 5'-nucleotidase-like isoform X2 [Physcomitrium patens]XP_024383281.1 cytosolic purine 5'-nucleotidase-like isoform X2 [Physcomitrium patens]|eukprot:XP_024383280.1 cytosolic purine 5'-nucleotidase-like isoform X2 [Physcomitrella patens]
MDRLASSPMAQFLYGGARPCYTRCKSTDAVESLTSPASTSLKPFAARYHASSTKTSSSVLNGFGRAVMGCGQDFQSFMLCVRRGYLQERARSIVCASGSGFQGGGNESNGSETESSDASVHGRGPPHGDDLDAWNNWHAVLPENDGRNHPVPAVDLFRVIESSKDSKFDIDYLGESTKGDMNVRPEAFEYGDSSLQEVAASLDGSLEEIAKAEAKEAEALLDALKIPRRFPHGVASRGIFCSRTLSLRSITTIGYDMDYTLIHYNVHAWEGRAYEYGMNNLRSMGYPVDGLKFDPELVIRGLVLDKKRGNLVKADRFGYIKRAMHGTKMLSNREISELYGRELVDLRDEGRWEFLNTLFSISESVMFMQMVERLDEGSLPPEIGPLDYKGLYAVVSKSLFKAHVEGQLKAEIINNPELFIELDPELPLALLDQKEAGKRLLLITNSDYLYTNKMMQYAFDKYLPDGMGWRALFDMVIVSARKPEFFQKSNPLYEIVTEEGLMRPCYKATSGGLYCGGSALMVEKALGFHGDETLYVGDHIYTDVSMSKVHLRWRTALICRELEKEVMALAHGKDHRVKLIELMNQKEAVGDVFNQLRLALQRRTAGRPAQTDKITNLDERDLAENMQKLLVLMSRLDQRIAPMLDADGEYFNQRWGYLSRAGLWDKSHLTRQIEKYADIYTSRVSNFLRYSPFMYFRSQSQTLAHDVEAESPDVENGKDELPTMNNGSNSGNFEGLVESTESVTPSRR